MTTKQIQNKLTLIGFIVEGIALSYGNFKNRSTIQRYGNKRVVFIGVPLKNLFAFYVTCEGDDSSVTREAYDMFRRLAKGDLTGYEQNFIQHATCEIPRRYEDINSK